MTRTEFMRALGGGLAVAALGGRGAAAHHGWAWAEAEQVELKGRVQEVYVGYPHPTLRVATASDGIWQVDLANPSQTARAGFGEGTAKPGDEVTALGNRSRDPAEKRLKAVRLSLGGRTYDLYPERIRGG